MAPVPQEQNKAAVGEPDITGNAANQAEFSKPAFTLSTSAVRQPEERVDEDDPFYRLLKSKRVSSANLKTLSSTSSSLGADDVLYSPTEGKFTNKLEVLEEVSEPDTASFSETDTRVPVISKNFSTAQRTARTVTTARRAGKAASEFSLNDRVSQSQYLLDQILHKLASKETATDRDFPFTSNLIANLRPHFLSASHIASHLELPTDKWSSFVQYIAWKGTASFNDATLSTSEEEDRTRTEGLIQISHALDHWDPQSAGSRRWATKTWQVCNLWQETLHNLQACSQKTVDTSTGDLEDEQELRTLIQMEDLAKSLCLGMAEFGAQWEDNMGKYLHGKANTVAPDALTKENLRVLKRKHHSMPNIGRGFAMKMYSMEQNQGQPQVSGRSAETLENDNEKERPSQDSKFRTALSRFSLAELLRNDLSISDTSRTVSNLVQVTDHQNRVREFLTESSTALQRTGKLLPRNTLSALERPNGIRDTSIAYSIDGKMPGKAKQAWTFIKDLAKQHHDSVNATYAAYYGQDSTGPVAEHLRDPETSSSYMEPLNQPSQQPHLLQPLRASINFSDLESYMSSISESNLTIKDHGPVSLPPRSGSMLDIFPDTDSDGSSKQEFSLRVHETESILTTQDMEVHHFPVSWMDRIEGDAPVPTTSRVGPIIDLANNNWRAPSIWNRSPSPDPRLPSGGQASGQVRVNTKSRGRTRIHEDSKEEYLKMCRKRDARTGGERSAARNRIRKSR